MTDEISSFDHLFFARDRLPRALSRKDPFLRGVVLAALAKHFGEFVAEVTGNPFAVAVDDYTSFYYPDYITELEDRYFAERALSPDEAVKLAAVFGATVHWPLPESEAGVNGEIRDNKKHPKIVRAILEECSHGERRHKHGTFIDPVSGMNPRFVVKMRGDAKSRRFLVRLRGFCDEQ